MQQCHMDNTVFRQNKDGTIFINDCKIEDIKFQAKQTLFFFDGFGVGVLLSFLIMKYFCFI